MLEGRIWRRKELVRGIYRIYKDTPVASLEALDLSGTDFAILFRVLCLAF